MKKLIALILASMLLCSAIPVFAEETPAHVLVVYFSHAGENYNVGMIEDTFTVNKNIQSGLKTNFDLMHYLSLILCLHLFRCLTLL